MTAASSSNPPSSPRLPSPPPFAENQLEPSHPTLTSEPPTSPSRSKSGTTSNGSPSKSSSSTDTTHNKYATVRRIRPGTKSAEIATGPPLVPLSELDSAFQLQEHLASLLASRTNRISPTTNGITEPDHTVPLSRLDCETISSPPEGVDPKLWCYELTRRLTRDLNILVVALIQDECTSKSCPEMRAGEWQYLCAAHDQPQPCCAIEYITHTLDHAAMVLCSTKYFPSRLSMTTSGNKQLSSIFRRLYRIFAHAWFQHRRVFWTVELEYGLYLFFKTASERYNLIPEDTLTIPKEAEDLDGMLAEQKAIQEAYVTERRNNPNGREIQDFGSFGHEEDDSDSDDSDELDADASEEHAEEGDLSNGTEKEEQEEENPFDDDSSSIDDESEDEELPVSEAPERTDEKAEQKEEDATEAVEEKEEATNEADEDSPKPVEATKEGEPQTEEPKEPELVKPKVEALFLEDEDAEGNAEVEELLDSFLKEDKEEQEKSDSSPVAGELKKEESAEKKKDVPSQTELAAEEPTVEVKNESKEEEEVEIKLDEAVQSAAKQDEEGDKEKKTEVEEKEEKISEGKQ